MTTQQGMLASVTNRDERGQTLSRTDSQKVNEINGCEERGLTPFISFCYRWGQTPSVTLGYREGQTPLVLAAVGSVDDPEYPGVSIVDLGLLESIDIDGDSARIGLIPTFSGCPALKIIAEDVRNAVLSVEGIADVEVSWLRAPVWTVERMSAGTRKQLATEFTVAVRIGTRAPACPLCGADTVEQSMFGPSRCRSVNRCSSCGETVEVMRS